jgi:uncharacterized protein (UPF0548 family)
MFFLLKPTPDQIHSFLNAQREASFSYTNVGASRTQASKGFRVDHHQIRLGHGRSTFDRAANALKQWKMFDIPWLTLCDAPVEVGATVAVLVFHWGFWSLNACRIVYLIQDPDQFGFGYGTLQDHAEIGEERFTVQFRLEDESVWYDLFAFSRPHGLARLAYPLTRNLQNRFARDSMDAMLRAVQRG